MKTNHILIALTIIAALSMVSCKNNNKKAQSQEPTQEEVQEMKQALADSVLAEIDAFADKFFIASGNSFRLAKINLSEEEKMIKPDCLLEPSVANTLTTKSQKINALAIYFTDLTVRIIYDMPLDKTKEVIAKLAAEINHPIDNDYLTDFDILPSEKVKKEYEECRERGDLAYFWQFQNAIVIEVNYLLAQNPELFFSKIADDQWQSYIEKIHDKTLAMRALAQHDEDMSGILQQISDNGNIAYTNGEFKNATGTISSAIEFYKNNKDKFIARRNALLQ